MNSTVSRISLAIVAMAFIAVTVFAITATWMWDWKLSLPATTDKATRVNTVIAVSAYAAALIGVVIALIAYWQASGRPSLEPEITFPRSLPNELAFEAYRPLQIPDWVDATTRGYARMLQIDDVSLLCTITIKNSSSYAAQNPGLRIKFEGLYLNALSAGWSVADSWGDGRGAKAIQWDGGTENIIHGKWSRKLPDLDFSDAITYRLDPPPELEITIVSDGCRPKTKNIIINLRGPGAVA